MIHRLQTGFTLIELMVTVAILAALAGIAIPLYNGYIQSGYMTQCRNEVASIKLAESEFYLENNSYFAGNDATTIGTASGGIYVPSTAEATGSANAMCKYTVIVTPSNYTITATGINKLATAGVVTTFTGP